jgi:hypothetical protein
VNYFSQTTTAGTAAAAAITYNTAYYSLANRSENVASALAGGVGSGNSLAGNNNIYKLNLLYGKVSDCKRTEIRLADLSFVLGYNVVANDKGFLGVGFKTTCPTGNVPTAQYALEPIFGRGGVWGIGADVMGHYKAWENDAQTRYMDVWFQGEVLHLAPGRNGHRSFDLLANGKGSKYLLLEHFHQNADASYSAGSLTQAANVTTFPVFSKFAVEGSAALMFDYHCNNWNLAVSGEFWGRTKETLSIDMCGTVQLGKENLNNYAVVGRQASFVHILSTGGVAANQDVTTNFVPLVEPAAKINTAQNMVTMVNNTGPTVVFPTTYPQGIVDGRTSTNRIPADLTEALDICGAAAAKAFTGKVFGQFGYTWTDSRYTPNVSVIGGAEFANNTNNAVSMWSAGLQGSINF